MDKLLKKRVAARGWVTRQSKNLDQLLNKDEVSAVELRFAIETMENRLANLDNVQAEVELELDIEDLNSDLDESDRFRNDSVVILVKANERLQELLKPDDDGGTSQTSNGSRSSGTAAKARLPKLELSKFSGQVTEWQSFWDQFSSHIDDTDLPVISKYSYLLSLLEGEAKSCVQGLSLTTANYKTACDLLKERFGRPERIIFHHVQALLSGNVPVKSKCPKYISKLWSLRDEILTHIRSLEGLGVSGKQCEIFLTPIILSRLPNDMRLEWARKGAGKENDLEWLLAFLQEEIRSIERSETFRDVTAGAVQGESQSYPVSEERRKKERTSSAFALHTTSEVDKPTCNFCSKKHKSEKCFEILKLSGMQRAERIKSSRVCYRCLGRGHFAKSCFSNCTKCNGKHNVLMCGIKLESKLKNNNASNVIVNPPSTIQQAPRPIHLSDSNASNVSHNDADVTLYNSCTSGSSIDMCTILQTARVKVVGANGVSYEAKVLFDNGSDRSYVSSKFVRKCKPKWISSKTASYSVFGGEHSTKKKQCNLYDLQLIDNSNSLHSLKALEISNICQPLSRPVVPVKVLDNFSHVQLADDYANISHIEFDILVGLDMYWKFIMADGAIQVDGVVAQRSVFGYVLSGSYPTTTHCNSNFYQMLCISRTSEYDLDRFWDLESVGIKSKESELQESDSVCENFCNSIQYFDGRYEVSLPWKSDSIKNELINNENLALKRLERLHSKLDKSLELKNEYYDVFRGYEKEGIIEEVPSHEIDCKYPVYYMPHRPVVKESNTSTKVRPVFDASASSYNGISLNDCLLTGPSLNPDLVEVLIRFRRWPIAVTGDITKAFLQIRIKREDRDVHRFLLKYDNDIGIRHMRFLRVPFGNTASPFLLNATIKYHLERYPLTKVIQELKDDMYVDNWLSGADSVDKACTKFCEASTILSHAGMSLAKWASNIDEVTHNLNEKFDYVYENDVSNVLGLLWCSSTDTFSYPQLPLPSECQYSFTKRSVLSLIAKIFDPLGLISPFVMYAKILFQDIWRLGISWDDFLPQEIQWKFQRWFESSEYFNSWSIDRCYFPDIPWETLNEIELHGFGDASEKGYGACIYIRIPLKDGSYKVSLVASRSRVAPIKKITLPRLELMGALLCARLITFVRNALHLTPNVNMICWTDSRITLSWIQGDPHKWKMFVSNRVTEIQSTVPPSCWKHCPGNDNPADLISRGALADQLLDSTLWFKGPVWLSKLSCSSMVGVPVISGNYDDEYFDEVPVVCLSFDKFAPVLELCNYSEFSKANRIMAWILRFINNCKPNVNKISGLLSISELRDAKAKLIFCEQRVVYPREIAALQSNQNLPKGSSLQNLDPFLDDQGLLRIKGRLENADLDYDSKHPIIIPNGHFAKLLISFQHLFLMHGGVSLIVTTLRNNFWIIGIRRLAKSIIRACVRCQRHDSRACNQSSPPLPSLRVKSAPPFTITGLDFAGPLFCADFPSKKFYILLFTCAVVRAIHLELTDSMSLSDCVLAIRRFVARRGLPSTFYSDNAKTFTSAGEEIKKVYGHLSPNWKFIVPRSPWWGGWWERLVRSVKSAMRKSLGVNCVSRTELETILHEIEASVNSRPLTCVHDNPDVCNPLTPSHFLIGRGTGSQVHETANLDNVPQISSDDLNEREILRQQLFENFWKQWSNDYIRNLPPVVKGFKSECNLKTGDMVLIKEDNLPRLRWPLGIIVDVFPDKEGVIRTVKVKTSKGVIMRSVQRLHYLEIRGSDSVVNCLEEDVLDSPSEPLPAVTLDKGRTRSGRVVKIPSKLDL